MLASLATIAADFTSFTAVVTPLLAQSKGGPSPSIQWAIVGFLIALGLIVTLSPSRRTFEVKRPKDE